MDWRRLLPVLIALAAVAGVRADELTLKDGSKIDGAIVGFEANSFRVKTSYGFAVVRKDQVVSIRFADSTKTTPSTEKSPAAGSKAGTAVKAAQPQASTAPAKSAAKQPAQTATASTRPAGSSNISTAANAPDATAPGSINRASIDAAVPSHPACSVAIAPAALAPIREEVTGNRYVNETYGFSMFKPPDWELIEGARTMLPGAIAALGTSDQTTYLLIGQDSAQKSIEAQMNGTANRLASIMDNFRPLAETRLSISGAPAIERRFHGTVDQKDWSGVVVLIPRGSRVFTIFGMTYAETDLVQIQENVISRAISSIQFARQ